MGRVYQSGGGIRGWVRSDRSRGGGGEGASDTGGREEGGGTSDRAREGGGLGTAVCLTVMDDGLFDKVGGGMFGGVDDGVADVDGTDDDGVRD